MPLVPPMVSALKVDGKRKVEIPPFTCINVSDPFTIVPVSGDASNTPAIIIKGNGTATIYLFTEIDPGYTKCIKDSEEG